jgi:hypothetical protein
MDSPPKVVAQDSMKRHITEMHGVENEELRKELSAFSNQLSAHRTEASVVSVREDES